MNKLDWNIILSINDIFPAFTLFMNMISDTLYDSFPVEAIKQTRRLEIPGLIKN